MKKEREKKLFLFFRYPVKGRNAFPLRSALPARFQFPKGKGAAAERAAKVARLGLFRSRQRKNLHERMGGVLKQETQGGKKE